MTVHPSRRHRHWQSIAVGLVIAAVLGPLVGCSDPKPDQVVIDDGSVPPDVTATTSPPATDGPSDTATPTTEPAPVGPPTLSDSSLVTTAGVDDVAFGMSVSGAEQAAGSRLSPTDADFDPDCYQATFEEGPRGLELVVVAGTVERLDVVEGTVTTRSGAGIGDTTAQLEELFGDQLEAGADPDGDGQVLTYVPSDESDRGTLIIFTIEDDKVSSFRAGRTPTVNTGC